jgi:hypothetical protein
MEIAQERYIKFTKLLTNIVAPQHIEHTIKLQKTPLIDFLTYVKSCGGPTEVIEVVENKFNIPIRSYHESDIKKCERFIEYFYNVSLL